MRMLNGLGVMAGLMLLLLCLACGGTPNRGTLPAQTCVLNAADVPESWRPPADLVFKDSEIQWTPEEQQEANVAVQIGLREMSEFMRSDAARVTALWDNSVEAFIDSAYAASDQPQVQAQSLRMASEHLQILVRPYMSLTGPPPTCDHSSEYLTLAVYAHSIAKRSADNPRMRTIENRLVERTNQALEDCGTLEALLGFDPARAMARPQASNPEVYGWVMWSVTLTDALSNPALKMPEGSARFVADTWRYLATYSVPQGQDHPQGLNHMPAYDAAYLMTHAGYMPTGYGRHRLTVEAAPWLYRYLRENYYAAMKMGELDLFAEFVDLLRQYGCTEESDAQLRHGSRYLLSLYRTAGDSWMAHRESYEESEISDYDALHKPWTAIAGLRRRTFEPLLPGSYGAAFTAAIGSAHLRPSDAKRRTKERESGPGTPQDATRSRD